MDIIYFNVVYGWGFDEAEGRRSNIDIVPRDLHGLEYSRTLTQNVIKLAFVVGIVSHFDITDVDILLLLRRIYFPHTRSLVKLILFCYKLMIFKPHMRPLQYHMDDSSHMISMEPSIYLSVEMIAHACIFNQNYSHAYYIMCSTAGSKSELST